MLGSSPPSRWEDRLRCVDQGRSGRVAEAAGDGEGGLARCSHRPGLSGTVLPSSFVRRFAILALAVAVSSTAAVAAAHPGAPWRTEAWAKKSVFAPGPGEFDDVSAKCSGIREGGPAGRYRHFVCITERRDGARFSLMLHSVNGAGFAFSDVRLIGGVPGYTRKVIASKSIQGDYATIIASGTAVSPARIQAQAIVVPDQRVRVSWTMVCSNDAGAASKSGSYSDFSRVGRTLQFPFRNPTSCTVAASASIAGSGRLTIRLIASRD